MPERTEQDPAKISRGPYKKTKEKTAELLKIKTSGKKRVVPRVKVPKGFPKEEPGWQKTCGPVELLKIKAFGGSDPLRPPPFRQGSVASC